ncbi:MAG: acyl-CoA synthetase [Alphaproteobacteria bacterium]|nr:acyl-CoA synthetase [Alphaproteobacteria bacterium]
MPENENARKTKKSKDSILTTGFAFLILFPMMYLMLPTVIFLFLAMLPTIVALVIDAGSKSKLKYKWLCVGGLNFSGALPFLFRLWFGNNTWSGAVEMFLNNACFIIVYLTAFVGFLLYRSVPPVVLSFLETADQRRVIALREAQTKLVAKWGNVVAADVADAKIPSVSSPTAGNPSSSSDIKTQ